MIEKYQQFTYQLDGGHVCRLRPLFGCSPVDCDPQHTALLCPSNQLDCLSVERKIFSFGGGGGGGGGGGRYLILTLDLDEF